MGKNMCMEKDEKNDFFSVINYATRSIVPNFHLINLYPIIDFSNSSGSRLITRSQTPLNPRIIEFNSKNNSIKSLNMRNLEIKYWLQRHHIFSGSNLGIRLDSKSYFSITTEKIATHQARRCICSTVLDGFCGAGGNTVRFGRIRESHIL